jgi:hypothetical protein
MEEAVKKRFKELSLLTTSEVRKVWDNIRMSEEKGKLINKILKKEFKEIP